MSTNDYKAAKDALVASLFELSKAANEVSKNAIDFFNATNGSVNSSNAVVGKEEEGVEEEDLIVDTEDVNGNTIEEELAVAAAIETKDAVVNALKKKRDPNAPKKPLTTYILYSNDMRAKIQSEHKDWPQTDIAKEISKLWVSLDADKKNAYKEIYEKDKERYLSEMQKYEDAKKNGLDYIAPSVLEYQEATKHKKEIAKAKAQEKRDRENGVAEAVEQAEQPSPKKVKKSAKVVDDAVDSGEKKSKKKKKSKKLNTINID